MSEAPSGMAVSVSELRRFIPDAAELKKGTEIFDKQGIVRPARYQSKLFGEVKGSGGAAYKVALVFGEGATSIKASCTCEAARSRPICKHAAALLIAWSRAPESFVVSDTAPAVGGNVKVREGKANTVDLMRNGLEQVATLVRELGTAGVASLAQDRVSHIQKLGESLREYKLWRLSARTLDLAVLLRDAVQDRSALDSCRYADLVTDMRITAQKIQKHLAGEPLDDRHIEELLGKTWKEADCKPIAGLRLVEVAFLTRLTSDDFVVRESRLVDVGSGTHYSEKQIVPAQDIRRHEPKRSYAASFLEGTSGRIYPGFPPFRLKLGEVGAERPLDHEVLSALTAKAYADVGSALAALQEHRRDLFAPDLFPVSIRVDTLLARGARLEAVDAGGHVIHLAEDGAVEERLGNALCDGRLCALIGDLGIDAALPTLWPLAVVIEGPLGLELRTLLHAMEPRPGITKSASERGEMRQRAFWAAVAREIGVSAAAIMLAEVREELADCFVAGLYGANAKTVEAIASRLRELGLNEQEAFLQRWLKLRADGSGAEPSARIDGFLKLYHVLGIALVRLVSTAHVDRESLERVPGYESVVVRRSSTVLEPREVKRRCEEGALNRYEAAAHFARYFERLQPEELSAHIYPMWADGSVSPYVARAFAGQGPEAIAAAERVPASRHGRIAKMTAVRVLQIASGLRAQDILHRIVHSEPDRALRALAEEALDAIDLQKGNQEIVRRRRVATERQLVEGVKRLLTASQKDARRAAVDDLVELGHRGALHALRHAFASDPSHTVREAAALALAQFCDTEMVETFVRMLAARREDDEGAKLATVALGMIGDVRGLDELLAAYAEGYRSTTVPLAIKDFGPAALEPFLDLLEARPELVQRRSTLMVLEASPAEDLGASLVRRLMEKSEGGISAELTERAAFFLKIADVQKQSRRMVAKAISGILGESEGTAERALVKLAQKALRLA